MKLERAKINENTFSASVAFDEEKHLSMPVSPRSPLAERVSFPSADADVTLEGRLALRRGGSSEAADGLPRSIGGGGGGGDASTSTPPPLLLPDLALVLLHPHAALGGSMADPICSAIYREARKHPRFGAVAKYNARGAGESGGGSGFGRGRLLLSSLWRRCQGGDDAAAVIRAVSTGEGIGIDGEPTFGDEEESEGEEGEEDGRSARGGGSCSSSAAAAETPRAATAPPFPLRSSRRRRGRKGYPRIARTFVVGYSWGSCVGAAAASGLILAREEERGQGGGEEEGAPSVEIGGFVAVSPPLGTAASLALGSGKCFSTLSSVPSLPVLVTMGDCDLFCSERAARSSVEGVNAARREARRGKQGVAAADSFQPLSLEISRGLDHFWGAEDDPWSREEIGRLAERVVAWVLEQDAKSKVVK